MASSLQFIVEGSKGDEYEISASRSGINFTMTCTCEAGRNGMYCKHRFALLDGDIKQLLSDNVADVEALKSMLAGSEVGERYKIVCDLEKQKATIDERLKAEKKALAREMNG